jgi:hypothetical protein
MSEAKPEVVDSGRCFICATPDPEYESTEERGWVQCEKCNKWRRMAVGASEWTGFFECGFNDWDSFNKCGIPEEVFDEESEEVIMAQQKDLGGSFSMFDEQTSGKRKKKPSSKVASKKNGADSPKDKPKSKAKSKVKPKPKPKPKGKAKGKPEKAKKEKDKTPKQAPKRVWVQCEKCELWRRLKARVKTWEGQFQCSMNDWDEFKVCGMAEVRHAPFLYPFCDEFTYLGTASLR